MSEGSSFDMNALLRGHAREDGQQDGEVAQERQSIGGRSDAGAGEEPPGTGSIDMNSWLRDAVTEPRGGEGAGRARSD